MALIPTVDELRNAFEASIQLLRQDASAVDRFGNSADDFWRSFVAMVPVYPIFLVMVTSQYRLTSELGAPITLGATGFVIIESFAYVISWALFPLAMIPVSRAFGLWHRFVPYIVVYNWTTLLVVLFLVPPHLFYSLGLVSAQGLPLIILVTMGIGLWYRWLIAVAALQSSALLAVGIVAMDFAIGLALNYVTAQLFYVPSGVS